MSLQLRTGTKVMMLLSIKVYILLHCWPPIKATWSEYSMCITNITSRAIVQASCMQGNTFFFSRFPFRLWSSVTGKWCVLVLYLCVALSYFKVKFDFKFKLYGGRQIEKSGNEVSCGQEWHLGLGKVWRESSMEGAVGNRKRAKQMGQLVCKN